MKDVMLYTVNELAKLSGVSVRTLHHFDAIGLLKPKKRGETSGYRYYGHAELLKLQQILFYRELEFPLKKIRALVSKPGFNPARALQEHRQMLLDRNERTKVLVRTIDKTLESLKEGRHMLTDKELYEGFSKEEVKKMKEYGKEAAAKYDPKIVAESNKKVRSMSKEQWDSVKNEGHEITLAIASLAKAGKKPSDPAVQEQIGRHYRHLHNFYTPNLGLYRGLGQGYAADERFRAFYEKYGPNLADFMNEAIGEFCERQSKG